MGLPDRIERTVRLGQPPDVVWAALTTADGLVGWFGDTAEIDLRPGGAGKLTWAGGTVADLEVECAEEPAVFTFSWQVSGVTASEPRTRVEFTLAPDGAGTRLTVTETGFARPPDEPYRDAYDGHVEGWVSELADLIRYLGAA